MIKLNNTYLELFLEPKGFGKEDYFRLNDAEIWGEATAIKFKQNDDYVLRTSKILKKRETFDVEGIKYDVFVIKFPIFANTDKKYIIGVGGIILFIDDL